MAAFVLSHVDFVASYCCIFPNSFAFKPRTTDVQCVYTALHSTAHQRKVLWSVAQQQSATRCCIFAKYSGQRTKRREPDRMHGALDRVASGTLNQGYGARTCVALTAITQALLSTACLACG